MEYYKNYDLNDIVYFCEYDLIWKTEIWKDIVDYKGLYEVSDLGRVKSLSRIVLNKGKYPFLIKERILKQGLCKHYLNIGLSKNGIVIARTVHQLVAEAFLNHKPCGFELVVDHINTDNPNNKTDNRVANLRIITARENSNQKHIKSSSKYIGVHWSKTRKKWISSIKINGKKKYLGTFINEIDAYNAYKKELDKKTK